LYLKKYLLRYRWKFLLGTFFVVLTNIFKVINPKVVQRAVDTLSTDFNLNQIEFYAFLIILFALIQGIFLFLMRRTIIVASREIEYDLRNDLFWKLEHLPASFYHKTTTGDIMSRATNDMNAVRSVLGPGIAYSINTCVAFLSILPMMFIINPALSLLALIPFPVLAVLVNRFGKSIRKKYEKIQNQLARISSFVQENLAGISVVKSYVRESYQIKQFFILNEEYVKRNLSFARVFAAFHPSLILIIGLSTLLVLVGGGRLVMDQKISIGEFTAFLLYLSMLIWPAISLGWVIGLFQQGAASMKRIRYILDSVPDFSDGKYASEKPKFVGEIYFNNLTFEYNVNQLVLNQLNLQIAANKTIGILGPTGSGKTTLVRLIPHLYNIKKDMIYIDGRDINEYKLDFLREKIGFVSQEPFLFSDTIIKNIALGKTAAKKEEVIEAAKIASIHSEIMDFKEDYDSLLGERGLNLSGGQKQRIAIARAILKNPQILILDDAFSALDTYTEEFILKNLQSYFSDRTVILISHRISTIQNSDTIVVMKQGSILEKGNHQELLKQSGFYSQIYEKQLLEVEIDSIQ
jgi:ATP-binding cassette subfamily B multidrug efflux pump